MMLGYGLEHFYPHFQFQRENRKQWFLLTGLIIGNSLQAWTIVLMSMAFSHFCGVFGLPLINYPQLVSAILEWLACLFINTGLAGLNMYFSEKLFFQLNKRMSLRFLKRWFESKTYYGKLFLPKDKPSNAAMVLSHDISALNKKSIKLFNYFLNTAFSFIVGIYGLYQLSVPITMIIAGSTVTLYGFMPLVAIAYSLVYALCVHWLGNYFKDATKKQNEYRDELEAHIHHVDAHAEGVALLQADSIEQKKIIKLSKRERLLSKVIAKLKIILEMIVNFNSELSFFIGLLLNIPQIVVKKIQIDEVFNTANYFSRVVGFFTWFHDNMDNLSEVEVLSGKLADLDHRIKDWEKIESKKHLKVYDQDEFTLAKMIIRKPNQQVVLDQKSFTFKKKKITLIQGTSGVGKTTLFRALAGLWPYVEGELTLPFDRKVIHVIPQKPFFPLHMSLHKAILYPEIEKLSLRKKKEMYEKIDKLLREFQLDFPDKNEKKNWGESSASGGQQQRLAIIRAIIRNPKLLLMDEPTASLDDPLRERCERLLRKYLPNTTIIYIDHHVVEEKRRKPVTPFYDERVIFKNKRLTRVKEDPPSTNRKRQIGGRERLDCRSRCAPSQ